MKKKIIISLFIIALLTFIYAWIEPYWIKIKKIEFVSEDVPEEFDNIKIIFIADIHHGPFFNIKRVEKVVNKINKIKPDIVLLGGDYVHRDKKYIGPVFDKFKNIKARLFYGGVLGNHDHWESRGLTLSRMDNARINQLDNRSTWVTIKDAKIKIGGVGDYWEDTQRLDKTVYDTKKEDFVILLSHNPEYFPKINDNRVDLVLSGHTHGGQATFFGLWAPILPVKNKKYWKGLYKNGKTTLYVTTGVGTITPPVRFFSRPEILVITLKNKK